MSWFLMLPTRVGKSGEQALLSAQPYVSAPFQVHLNIHRTEIHGKKKLWNLHMRKVSSGSCCGSRGILLPPHADVPVNNKMAAWHCSQLGKLLHLQPEIPGLNRTSLRPFVINISVLKMFPSVGCFASLVPVKSFESNSVIESANHFLSSSPSVMFI